MTSKPGTNKMIDTEIQHILDNVNNNPERRILRDWLVTNKDPDTPEIAPNTCNRISTKIKYSK
jgi:hypothetical protein